MTAPGDLGFDVRPVAFGSLRLVSPQGCITHFQRALAEIRGVAVDVAASIAAKLTGASSDDHEVAAAVDSVMAERAA